MADDVEREATHDWLDEREPKERPHPSEYEDLDDGFGFRCPQCGTDEHDSSDHYESHGPR